MKQMNRGLSLLLAMVVLAGMMAQSVFAAKNVCGEFARGSAADCNSWVTITITTGKNWLSNKINFTQTKGTLKYNHLSVEGETKLYGAYTIKVSDGSSTKEYYWKYKQNYSLKLKDNTTYTIKIKPYQPATVGDQKGGTPSLWMVGQKALGEYSKFGWSWGTAPTWRVSSTKAIASCSLKL